MSLECFSASRVILDNTIFLEPTRIYCAGPLFTPKEREEMDQLNDALEAAGYETFLPQRDGLELTKCVEALVETGISAAEAGSLMSRAIFALDVFQVLERCDALVANLNGRVPDEGTVSEASMAWSSGKIVVGYKSDSRTVFGGQDNPLVAGLFRFDLCTSIERTVQLLRTELHRAESTHVIRTRESVIDGLLAFGGHLWSALERRSDLTRVVDVILESEAAEAEMLLSTCGRNGRRATWIA